MESIVGIIIVNYNTLEETICCVNSIRKHTTSNYQIYIVDNGSKEEICEKLSYEFQNSNDVVFLALSDNLGYSAGNNFGIKRAINDGCDYIMIVNSDVEFKNDVIGILKEDLVDNVAVSGPSITNLDNKDGQQLIKTYSLGSAFLDRMPFVYIKRVFGLYRIDARKIKGKIIYSGMVQGSCFIIKSDDFSLLGFFDDNVFLYSEERILSIKMKNQGLKVSYNPSAQILHKEGQSTKKTGNAFADYHRYISDYYTIIRYCRGPIVFKKIIKQMRLFSYRLKQIKHPEYKPYFPILLKKMKMIEAGEYKILFKN